MTGRPFFPFTGASKNGPKEPSLALSVVREHVLPAMARDTVRAGRDAEQAQYPIEAVHRPDGPPSILYPLLIMHRSNSRSWAMVRSNP